MLIVILYIKKKKLYIKTKQNCLIHRNIHIIYITHVLAHIICVAHVTYITHIIYITHVIYITQMVKLIFKADKKTDKIIF